MITWIKFSERQPEKEGHYLCWYNATKPEYSCYLPRVYVLNWEPIEKTFFNLEKDSETAKAPDYWAEINPPEEKDITKSQERENSLIGMIAISNKLREIASRPGRLKKDPKLQAMLDQLIKEPPMTEKPLCKDCRFFTYREHRTEPRCSHNDAPRSLIDGQLDGLCEAMRCDDAWIKSRALMVEEAIAVNHAERCGPEGRWFEAKEPPTKVRPAITLGLTAGERADFINVLDKIRQYFQ